jgi:mRNA interferase HigB
MRVISKGTLRTFWEQLEYKDAEQPLKCWYKAITESEWTAPQAVTNYFNGADYVGNGRIVFNICGNKYRLIVALRYDIQVAYVRFIGTHKEYDRIVDIRVI